MLGSEVWLNIIKTSSLPIAIFGLRDKLHPLIFANDAYLKFFGIKEAEVLNKPLSEIFNLPGIGNKSDLVPELINSFNKVLKSGQAHQLCNVEFSLQNEEATGPSTFYFDVENSPIQEEGEINYISQSIIQPTKPNLTQNSSLQGFEPQDRAELIETILQSLPIGIAVNRIDTGEATLVNSQFSETYGWSDKDLVDIKSFFEKVYPDVEYREKILNRVMDDINSGDATRMSWENIEVTTSTGERKKINAKNIPLLDQNLMISTVVDVTLKSKNAEEISRTKVNLQALIDGAEDLIWSVDSDCRLITANKAFLEVLKHSTGRDLKEGDYVQENVYDEKINKRWKAYYDRTLAGENFTVKEESYIPSKNRIDYSEVSFCPMRDGQGEVFGAACYSKDITNDTLALIDLRKAELEINLMINNTEESFILLNMDMEIVSFNDQFDNLYKYYYKINIKKGESILNYAQPERRAAVADMYNRVFQGQSEVSEFTVINPLSEEKNIFSIKYKPAKNAEGEIIGAFVTAIDITEKQLVLEKLMESEERYKLLFRFSPLPNFIYDIANFQIVDVNDTAIDHYGYSRVEFLKMSIIDITAEHDRKKLLKMHKNIQLNEQGVDFGIFHHIKKNGELIYSDISAYRVNVAGCDCMMISCNDVTEREIAFQEVQLSEARHRGLFESQTNYMIRTDLEGNYTFCNHKFLNDFGWLYQGQEIIGKNCLSSILEYHHERVIDTVTKCLDELNTVFQVFIDKPREDGKGVVSTLWDFICLTDSKGQPTEIQCVGIDMSEWKAAQEELEASIARYEYVTQATSDAIWDWDMRNDEMYRGGGYQTLFGYSPESYQQGGRFWEERIHPDDFQNVLNTLDHYLKGEVETWSLEYRFKKSNGDYAFVHDKGVIIRDSEGTPTRMVGTMQDISESKIAEKQKFLHAETSSLFNQPNDNLHDVVEKVLQHILSYGDIALAEIWLLSSDKKHINLYSKCTIDKNYDLFHEESFNQKSFILGEGLPGKVWESREFEQFDYIKTNKKFIRRRAAGKVDLKSFKGLPLVYNEEFLGALVLGLPENGENLLDHAVFRDGFCGHLSSEIKRKQLDQELKQIFSFAPDVISVAGTDGYFKKINPAACEMLEYTEEELLSSPIDNFVHPDDRNSTSQVVKNIGSGTTTFYFENRYITKSGKIIWFAWTSTPSPEEGLVFAVAKDITEKKNLELLLEKSNSLAEIGSWELDIQNNSVFWSGITKQIHEVDNDFRPNFETAINFYPEGYNRDSVRNAVERALTEGISWDMELQIITVNGNTRWVRVIGEAEFLNGKCLKLYGSLQNITNRKVSELELLKIFEEKNAILESIGDGFFTVDRNWIVNYWNKEAEKLLGKTKSQTIGKDLRKVFENITASPSYAQYQEAIDTNQVVHFVDYYPQMHKWYEISAYPSVDGLSVFFKDITERKIYDIQLRDLNTVLRNKVKELAISNRELEEFAYVASHDLQEPLRMISSFLTQLQRKYNDQLDQKAHQYIEFAVDGAKRMRQIILDLLDFSRVGRDDLEVESVNLNEVINEILILFRKIIEEKNAQFVIGDLPSINVPKANIRQLMQNLISNALKYQSAESNPLIEVGSTDKGDYWEFWVKDNGIGISPDYFDKIFIIFQRLHTKEQFSGTGMGLAICRKIVENLGGKLWIESEEGNGSTFYFTIPKQAKLELKSERD